MTRASVPPLDGSLVNPVLGFLGCRRSRPSLRALDHLISAYVNKIPWETVFRILKRHATADTLACPRLPPEFWHDALQFGGGGTCYENNYAFMSLLRALGYTGYMTVNDLGLLHGNHAAGIVVLDRVKYIVDVSIPIPRALPLDPVKRTRRKTTLHDFIVTPLGRNRFQVSRTRHPKTEVYLLIDRPVSPRRYLQIMTDDYGPAGQFLSHVIIVRMRDGILWRYNQAESCNRIEGFGAGVKRELFSSTESLAEFLAQHFEIDVNLLHGALVRVGALGPDRQYDNTK